MAPLCRQAILLADVDGDGALDLLEVGGPDTRLLHDDGGRFNPGATLPAAPRGAQETRAAAGDYDNDGRPDLFVSGPRSGRLLHQKADHTFEDVTAAVGLPADLHAGAASWVDVDHDGDLDLVTASPVRLLRNDSGQPTGARFTDVTRDAGLALPGPDDSASAAIVPTDYDNHRDVDLLILSGGGAPRLFRNKRDGTFENVASQAGLPAWTATAAAAADANKDGFIDFFFGRADGAGMFALSDGRGRFRLRDAPAVTRGASLAQFVDYDNDGLLDLLVVTPQGLRLLRNLGDGWSDETARAGLDAAGPPIRSLALGDVDRDRATDLIALREGREPELRRSTGGNPESRDRGLAACRASAIEARSAPGWRSAPAASTRCSRPRPPLRPSAPRICSSASAIEAPPTSSGCSGRPASCRRRSRRR